MKERDFSMVTFKVNCSGSWANLVIVPAARYDEAKAACTALAKAHRGSIRFKAIDAAGGVIEEYSPVQGCSEWHVPETRKFVFPTTHERG